jgi:hypothetical protein
VATGRAGESAAAWDQQSVWSRAADRAKTGIDRARALSLASGLTAVVLGTAASQTITQHTAPGKALAFGAACATWLVSIAAR